jgi:alpha-mannosidase
MSENKKIYTVATAHLDTVWSWDFETTVSKYIYNTLVDNFKLFEKYPTYHFSFEGSYRYELMQEYYPELFEKMKEYVAHDRWSVCGSAFENGDVNVPSPEALFRNILLGNSYFEKTFGKKSVDIYLPDCFGFGWALPSIAAHAHLMGFTTQKLAWGSAYGVPFDLGKWQGVDGESIYVSFNPHSYYYTLTKLRDWDFVLDKLKENEKYDLDWTYIFHGIGDRGGAPEEPSVEFVENEIKKNSESNIEVVAAAADEIFHDMGEKLTPEQKEKLPVWKTELVMQNHAVGGYTSRALGKRWNRRCEELADVAERGGVISSYLGTADYNQTAINRAWKRFIAHQFHDDLPGTSCQRVYRRSWNDYAISMNQFTNELEAAVAPVSQLMKTDFCLGIPVMVFNPIEAQRRGAVTVRLTDVPSDYVRVYDEKGKEIKSQITSSQNGNIELVFVADVRSLGTRIYDIRPSDKPCCVKSEISINTDDAMENQKYIVTLNRKGNICSILDKELDEQELLKEPITLGMFNYTGSKDWPAWEMNFNEQNKEADRIPNVVTVTVLEQGPARVSFKVEQKDGNSTFNTIVALTDGCDVVEVYSEIEWQSLRTLAKNRFSFNCANDRATFDLGLGAIKRENMCEKLFEVPAQKWADITDKSGDFGVSVISECKYGWDKFKDNTLRLTVLHTPVKNYRIDSMQSFMDLGLNRYSYAIFSHRGEVGADTQLEARKFITPMTTFVCTKHQGTFGTEYSFGEGSTNDIIIRAIKKAEDSDEIIVRLGEGTNKEVKDYKLTLGEGIESAAEIYASEEYKADAKVENGALVCDFKPYEIKSFALKLKPSAVSGERAVSVPLNLHYDKSVITKQGASGEFEFTVPYEIAPEKVVSNGVCFDINKDGANAAAAEGQTLELPDGISRAVLLCASLDGDKTAEFKLDGKAVKKRIFSCFERFARGDLYDFGETAYVKKGKLAYEATHAHKDGNDMYAKGMYFYLAEFDVSGEKSLTLPKDNNIVIIGAAGVKDTGAKLACPTYDEIEKRPFNFKLGFADKLRYIYGKCLWRLNDKDGFLTDNNKGKNDD